MMDEGATGSKVIRPAIRGWKGINVLRLIQNGLMKINQLMIMVIW